MVGRPIIIFLSIMKSVLQILILCLSMPCFAQPTGHQKIYLEITEKGDTIHFENNFRKGDFGSKAKLSFKYFQLVDISKNRTGFSYYPYDEFIHKTLMTDDHEFVIVKNKKDTMRIELFNAFNVYFLSIPFQKGNFRMYVNDGRENKWAVNTLPYKKLGHEQLVYNLTPNDWSVFRVSEGIVSPNYSVETQFRKQGLLAKPVLPENDPNFRNPRRINTLRVETADYNFDGQKDYREQKWNNNKEWNYFIYADTTRGYVLDTMLSSMNIIEFDFEKKTINVQDGKSSKSRIVTYQFINGKPSIVPQDKSKVSGDDRKLQTILQDTGRSTRTILMNPFRFELERNYPDVELPAAKGYYANRISVYDLKNNQLIYNIIAVGNQLKETPGCADSLQTADYNFDGYPDFRVCNNSVPGKHTYYIFHEKRKTFSIEYTLSELNGLSFDFENKTAQGSTDRKEFASYPWDSPYQYYMETLQFKGIGLENLTVKTTVYGSSSYISAQCKYVNQKRIYEGDTIGLMLQRKNLLIKEVGPFKFEIEFNPEEVKTSGEKGAYVKVLNIFKGERNVGHFQMHGNYLKEVPHWLDSMEIADYNFDGFPDIRMYKSTISNGSYSYLLFNSDKDILQFYEDGLLSSAIETEYIPNKKIIKGKIVEPNLTRYYFLKNDTLTITIQDNDLSKPPFIEESIYKNGNRKGLRSAYGKLEPEIKREYGDYNFDGHDDFRQQSKKSPYYWDVFIYNPKKESFEKDTLLSKLEVFEYDKLDKKLQGSFRIESDGTTWITKYYQWRFTESKMILYQEKVCYSEFPGGESQRCIISRLVDGKWIETETFGAE